MFSIVPEGMTRACPIVPLISRKARPTQNHAMISRWILVFTGRFGSSCFSFFSAFMFHHYRPLCGRGLTVIPKVRCTGFAVGRAFAHLELHEVRWIDACITRRTKLAFGITERAAKRGEGYVAERIGAEELADFFR